MFVVVPTIQARAEIKKDSVGVIYDVDLEQQQASETNVGPGLAEKDGSLWLAAKFDRTSPHDHALNSHLWKLDSSGKKVIDVELSYPATSARVVKDEQSVVAGIELSGEDLKVLVNYPEHSEFWVLYFTKSGVLEHSKKIIEGDVHIARVVFSAEESGDVAFGVEGTGLKVWRLDREDKVLWGAQLPSEESIILDASIGHDAQVFVTTLDKTADDKPATTIFVFDSKGRLRQKKLVDGLNLGLFVNGKDISSLRTTPDSKLALVVLAQDSLIQKLSIPTSYKTAVPLTQRDGNIFALASEEEPSDESSVVVLSSDKIRVRSSELPRKIDPRYFALALYEPIATTGPDIGYVFLLGKSGRSISRVLAFALPKD